MRAPNAAHIAQSAEHYFGKVEVTSSILVMGSKVKLLDRLHNIYKMKDEIANDFKLVAA